MKTLDWIALVLIILGALNWGVVALLGFNMFGVDFAVSGWARVFYVLVGLAAIWMAITLSMRQEVLIDYDKTYKHQT